MANVRPFNYRYDGTLNRTSKAWYTRDDGVIVEAAIGERRVLARGTLADPWIYIEGARQNYLNQPLRADNVAWTDPANATTVVIDPTGASSTVGRMAAAETINQQFLVGAQPVSATWSIYAKTTAVTDQIRLNVVNGTPNTTVDTDANPIIWVRAIRKNIALSGATNKLAQANTDAQTAVWGGCVETEPAFGDSARFPSEPILETGVRTAEQFIAGAITAPFLAAHGGPKSVQVSFEPDFASNDVVLGEIYMIVMFDSGVAASRIALFLEGTGAGTVRVRAGVPTGTLASSGNITFSPRQRITLSFEFAAGGLTVQGASTGNGTFTNGVYALPVSSVDVGVFTVGSEAFALIGPLEFNFAEFFVGDIDQLTRNSVKVTFADNFGVPVNVLQFSEHGLTDALNPANYVVTGSPGLPRIQTVEPGDDASEVVLVFDGMIEPGALVTISVLNVVLAGAAPVPIYMGTRGVLDGFASTGGAFTWMWDVVQPDGSNELGFIETILWGGPGPKPGTNGVVIQIDDPTKPGIQYYYVVDETTAVMEANIMAVAGHLIRLRIPTTLRLLTNTDEFVQLFDFVIGETPLALSLIAFGAEVNAVAETAPMFPRVDIANPQTDRDASQGDSLGTFSVTDTGDLANDHGRTYLRKRIFRRLATFRAGFFHLVDYGLAMPSKALFTPTTLRRLKLDIESQVRQEPGVVAARATVTELQPGVVSVKLRVQDDNGSFELEGALDFTAE